MSINDKPLFIPLKREYFEAFRAGIKREEYRQHGPRWHAGTCRIGRRVVLSLGYGTQQRLTGIVTGFRIDPEPQNIPGWAECYGNRNDNAACIEIKLDPCPPLKNLQPFLSGLSLNSSI